MSIIINICIKLTMLEREEKKGKEKNGEVKAMINWNKLKIDT